MIDIKAIAEEFDMSDDLVNITLSIKQNCKPYLRENYSPILDLPLYRGVKTNKAVFKRDVRLENRKPLDNREVVHQGLNDVFKERFGEEFRNSLFATGDITEASNYGNVYYIFPIGEFSYLWSPDVYDIYGEWLEMELENARPIEFINNMRKKEWKHNTELLKAIRSGREIMIRCKSYYGVTDKISLDNKRGMDLIFKL